MNMNALKHKVVLAVCVIIFETLGTLSSVSAGCINRNGRVLRPTNNCTIRVGGLIVSTSSCSGTAADEEIECHPSPGEKCRVDAGAGNDVVRGSDKNDDLCGGSGKDRIFPGRGNDYANGGSGDDIIRDVRRDISNTPTAMAACSGIVVYCSSSTSGVAVSGTNCNDTICGTSGRDWLYGGARGDAIFGGSEIDTVIGGGGADYLDGGSVGDTADGDEPNDQPGQNSDGILEIDCIASTKIDCAT
jgi:hypothetical protein